jgi:hypothetical protein
MPEPSQVEINSQNPNEFIGRLSQDREHHLLTSLNWDNPNSSCQHIIIGTGSPEGAGYLAGKNTLKTIFQLNQLNDGASPYTIAQLYCGNELNPNNLTKNLEYTLNRLPQTNPADLILYSYSALALANLSLYSLSHLHSLTLMSPFMGNIVNKPIFRQILGHLPMAKVPESTQYLSKVTPQIQRLQENGVPISIVIGKYDQDLDNKVIIQQANILGIPVTFQERGHAVTSQNLLEIIQPSVHPPVIAYV